MPLIVNPGASTFQNTSFCFVEASLTYYGMKALLFVSICFLSFVLFSQNSIHDAKQYSKIINRAELCICDSDYVNAIRLYEKAFKYSECPYTMDVYNYLLVNMILGSDSLKINNSLRMFAERGYELIIYKKYFGKYKGYSKIDTTIFNYSPPKSEMKMKLDSFLAVDQRFRYFYFGLYDTVSLFPEVDSSYLDSMNENCLSFINFLKNDFPDERDGKLSIVPRVIPLYAVVFQHYHPKYNNNDYPFDSLLIQKTKTGEFHPEWFLFLYYERAYNGDSTIQDFYGYPVRYVKYDEDMNKRYFEVKTEYTKKQIRKIDRNRKKINLEPYSDYMTKSRFEYNGVIFRLTCNNDVVFRHVNGESSGCKNAE